MKLKRHNDFINESDGYDDFSDEGAEYKTEHGQILTEDPGDDYKHYNNDSKVDFGVSDVSGGEIVPVLKDIFNADIDASGIGLKNLNYFPSKQMIGDLNISHNDLTNLNMCPFEVHGDFYASTNKLTSLEGFPSKVESIIDLTDNLLTNLKGIKGDSIDELYLNNNEHLTSTEGLGQIENVENLMFDGCTKLTTLKEMPTHTRHLDITGTGIKSLRSIFKVNVMGVESDVIDDFEIDFYFDGLNNNSDVSYDQQLVDHLIVRAEYDPIKDRDVYDEDYRIEDYLEVLDIDYSNIIVTDKYKNVFKSLRSINKFNL